MPIYEYHCGRCEKRVEVLVRSSTTVPLCPECGGLLTNKLFSAPIVLSGRTRQQMDYTCCGQSERCEEPACAQGGTCHHE